MALSAIEHQTLCLPAPAAPQTFGSGSVLGLLCWHGIRANLSRLPAHRTRPVSCRASGLWSGFESRARAVTVHFHGRGIGHGVLHMAYCISGWSLTASKSFLPDMALPPSRKRLKTELHLPNSSGQSRQGLCTRSTARPLQIKRLFAPLGPASTDVPRQYGVISAHCLSLDTHLSMAGLQP